MKRQLDIKGLSPPPPISISISTLVLFFTILGNFGVSDADLGLNPPKDHTPSSHLKNRKLVDMGGGEDDMRLLDQVVINALAAPSQWIHLRQLFERVDSELRNKSSHYTNGPEEQFLANDPSKSATKRLKFSYHRVISQGGVVGRPFTGVTLLDQPERSYSDKPLISPLINYSQVKTPQPEPDYHHLQRHRLHHEHPFHQHHPTTSTTTTTTTTTTTPTYTNHHHHHHHKNKDQRGDFVSTSYDNHTPHHHKNHPHFSTWPDSSSTNLLQPFPATN